MAITNGKEIVAIEDAFEYDLLRNRQWWLATMECYDLASKVSMEMDKIQSKYSKEGLSCQQQ